MRAFGQVLVRSPPRAEREEPSAVDPHKRLRVLVDEHHDFVWRSLRRLGVSSSDADDGVQRVFLVAARKLADIRLGSERPFLFQTAVRVAADDRRARRRRREVPDEEERVEQATPSVDALRLLELRRARERLDRVLDKMPIDLRSVFILFELEEMTMAQIATLLGLRPGTVASRLRRARVLFDEEILRVTTRDTADGDKS
jgi:RNA polymerase sigma-70 factor (ECF subfamily)